jgi:TPR repeat protein
MANLWRVIFCSVIIMAVGLEPPGRVAAQTAEGVGQADTSAAMDQALPHARDGNAAAQNIVGSLYLVGRAPGELADSGEARKWFELAAAQGYAPAQVNLATLLLEDGTDEGAERGIALLELASASGHALAKAKLGLAHLHGVADPASEKIGIELLSTASAAGEGFASYELATAYLYGTGVDIDEAEAQRLFLQSAEQGYPTGQYVYATKYEKDEAQQFQWLQRAAQGGSPLAQYYLGQIHAAEGGPRHDLEKGIALFRMAALNGDERGNQALFRLGLPDVRGRSPVNATVPSSVTPGASAFEGDDPVVVFAAGLMLAIMSTATLDGDGSAAESSADDWEEAVICEYGEFNAGGFCMSYPDDW